MKPKTRKLLSVTGAVLISMGATTAAATGNLRPAPEKPKPTSTADAGTPAPKEKPADKKQ
jgi:hypothetical protein